MGFKVTQPARNASQVDAQNLKHFKLPLNSHEAILSQFRNNLTSPKFLKFLLINLNSNLNSRPFKLA